MTEKTLKIYGRSDVATAILLTYCSPLRFTFQGMDLPRGWMDILIIGDTRCGKSAVAEAIVAGIKMGEFFTCENVSFAGLVGGLQQMGSKNKWDICWGKMPINNGKLLVADEMSSLPIDAIGNMSGVRSSGVAEISKVQGGIARAACRMIWISNPRSELDMSSYPHGVRAIPELIGRPEDIARFDLALGLRRSDVPLETINAITPDAIENDPKWDNLRVLVKWAWRLRPNDVEFTPDAVHLILRYATDMAKKYHASIPLVEPNEQRVKIARVSAATAVRCFSEHCGRLVVKPQHVEFATWFMQKCFDSHGLMYNQYSDAMRYNTEMHVENTIALRDTFQRVGANKQSVQALHFMDIFGAYDVEHILDVPKSDARTLLSMMIRFGILSKTPRGYRKTPLGVESLGAVLETME